MTLTLREQIETIYPELVGSSIFAEGIIFLQDDSDGLGVYIREWNYSKPIPDGLKIGK